MPAQLVALTGGPNIFLDKPILLFGRHPECDIQLDSRKISRRHCCIAQVGDYLVIRDLGSTNGLRINGVPVLEGKLRSGDELTIGNYRYQISWDAFAAAAPAHLEIEESARRDPVRAGSPANEDDLLEACDEPVPLEEEADDEPRAKPGPRLPPIRQTALEEDVEEQATARPPVVDLEGPSLILPDNLELMPIDESPPPRNTVRKAPLPG